MKSSKRYCDQTKNVLLIIKRKKRTKQNNSIPTTTASAKKSENVIENYSTHFNTIFTKFTAAFNRQKCYKTNDTANITAKFE